MTESIKYKDWDEEDFRFAEERIRVTAVIRSISAERDFSHATVQEMFIRNRHRWPRHLIGLAFITVHFQKKEWIEAGSSRHVPARIYFTENCELREMESKAGWGPELEGIQSNPEWGVEEE